MTAELKSSLVYSIEAAAQKAGLVMASAMKGTATDGRATAVFHLALPGAAGKTLSLELRDAFDFNKPNLLPEMTAHLAGVTGRAVIFASSDGRISTSGFVNSSVESPDIS